MKFNFPINNFAAGEWSPKMLGRTDTDQYAKACTELENFIPQMTGGAAFRGGTKHHPLLGVTSTYLDAFLNPSSVPTFNPLICKLISYVPYDTTKSKILILAPTKWFIWPANNSISQEVTYGTNAATAIASGNWGPKNTRYTVLGDLLILTNTAGNFRPLVFWYNSTTLEWRVDMWGLDYAPISLFHRMFPWGPINAQGSGPSLTPSATTGSITITCSASKFTTADVGTYIRFCSGTSVEGVARVTGYTSSSVVSAFVIRTLPAAGAYGTAGAPTTFWQESQWSDRYGWPRHVVAHEGRLIFGGSPTYPDTIWGSRISNYFNFEEVPSPNTDGSTGFASSAFTADNSRSFTLTPNSPEASAIVGLSSGSTLIVHTQKAEIVAYGSNGALGPVNAVFESTTSYGAAEVQPVRVNNFSTFVQATGRNIRDIVYNSDEEQFKSTDLAFVADHFYPDKRSITGYASVLELAKVEGNSSVLYTLTNLGDVNGVTLDRDYRVNAWFRTRFGGNNEEDSLGDTNAKVLAITDHFLSSTTRPALYMLVFRVINGVARVTMESIQPPWDLGNPANFASPVAIDHIYLDSAVPGNKLTATTWDTAIVSGIYKSPLRNAVVSVVADGNYIGDFQVDDTDDGIITLPREYDSIYAGFKYRGRIVPTPLEQGGQIGVPVGRIKRANEICIRFYNSLATKYGRDGEMYEIPFREPGTPINQAAEYFTGDKVVTFPQGYDRKYQIEIEQDKPYPCHIVSVAVQGTTYD